MGTEELLINRIEIDLKKLRKKIAEIKDLQIKSRLERLEKINPFMYEDLNGQLNELINPVFKFEENYQLSESAKKFNSLFKN